MKSLFSALLGIAGLIALVLLILKKGIWGPLILLALAVLYFGISVLSEAVKLYGKKIQGRDSHP